MAELVVCALLDLWATLDRRYLRNLCILLLVFIIVVALSACTYVKTETLTVIDFHPVGGLTEIEATKPDGTKISASRGQGSAEGLVRAVSPNPLD